ncbi:MAG: hypothetical protein ACJA1C_002163 [Crocinitomicaceae bacterium]|jgi:hypothetical protein
MSWKEFKKWFLGGNEIPNDAEITQEEIEAGQLTQSEIDDGQLSDFEIQEIENETIKDDPFGINQDQKEEIDPIIDWWEVD